jgi:4-amino-4-deoxy-L-arabinose transferase-like glycosyltransferase
MPNDSLAKKSCVRVPRAILYLFAGVVLARLVIAALVPIVQDEAYYVEWSTALDWGYFDHPPLIAWVNATSRLWPSSALMGRLGAMLAAALAFPFMVGLFRKAGLTQSGGLLAALLFANLNVYVFTSGVLTTPDAVQITTWCAALHEGAAALTQDRRRWVTAGLAAGIGLLGKYTMILIGPVFLWGIVRGDPKALRTPWPYAGFLAALLAFAPHLAWNVRHQWVPIRMQLQHGFAGGHDPGFSLSTDLPVPQRPAPNGPEMRVGRPFGARIPAERPSQKAKAGLAESVEHVAGYLGGLLVVWGAFLGVLIHRLVLRLRRRPPPGPVGNTPVKPLLVAATWFPILLFATVSLVAKVEANWAAVYVIAAAALLAEFHGTRVRDIAIHGGINVIFCLALALYLHHPLGAPAFAHRVLKETAGWRQLAQYIGRLNGPLLTNQEQLTSMIRFYQPGLKVAQWPGLAHPSEFVRRPEWNYYTRQSLREHGSFWLISGGPLPPRLEGFEPVEMIRLTFRLDQGLVATKGPGAPSNGPPVTEEPIHEWYVIRYHVAGPPPSKSVPRCAQSRKGPALPGDGLGVPAHGGRREPPSCGAGKDPGTVGTLARQRRKRERDALSVLGQANRSTSSPTPGCVAGEETCAACGTGWLACSRASLRTACWSPRAASCIVVALVSAASCDAAATLL